MTRKSAITYLGKINAEAVPLLLFAIMYPAVHAILLLLMPFTVSQANAEEPKIFTDADLEKYNAMPMVDQETAVKSEEALNSYRMKKSAELLLEKEAQKKEEMKKQQAEGAKRLALQRQKKKVTVSQAPVSVRRITGST